MSYSKDFDHDGERLRVQLKALGDGQYECKVGERVHAVTARRLPDGRVRFELAGEQFDVAAAPRGGSGSKDVHVTLGGASYWLRPHTGRRAGGHGAAADGVIVAPMTGTVLAVHVAVGDEVAAEDTVAVVSAMKMEHKLLAGVAGRVVEVQARDGASVDQDELLMRIEPVAASG